MNSHDPSRHISQSDLDQLVDGRLDQQQYRELIQEMDHQPDGWKKCAVAFLENQALARELSQLAHPDDDQEKFVDESGEQQFLGGVPTGDATDDYGQVEPVQLEAARFPSRRTAGNWLVLLAACALIVITVLVLRPKTPPSGDGRIDIDSPVAENPNNDLPGSQVMQVGNMNFQVDGTDENRDWSLPVVQTSDPNQWLDEQANSADFQPLVQRYGQPMKQSDKFVKVRLEDGREVLIPYSEVLVLPRDIRRFK